MRAPTSKPDSNAACSQGSSDDSVRTPVEVVRLKPITVQEDLQAVGSLRSNESVILRPEVSGPHRGDRIQGWPGWCARVSC